MRPPIGVSDRLCGVEVADGKKKKKNKEKKKFGEGARRPVRDRRSSIVGPELTLSVDSDRVSGREIPAESARRESFRPVRASRVFFFLLFFWLF